LRMFPNAKNNYPYITVSITKNALKKKKKKKKKQ
jgi:hypothetical protein